ncbi:MAG: hypothetical protein U0350_46090 [Caldilineaceae bacterium]
MLDRQALRLAATLSFVGLWVFFVAGYFHVDRYDANNHVAAFADYADSGVWILAHLGQFAGMALINSGLIALYFALNLESGRAQWVSRFAAIAALCSLALYGVLQAVDGVALKHAVDAWARAAEAEKPLRFAAAEAVRWLEWGVRSYQSFVLGLAFLLFAGAISGTAQLPRLLGYLMGLSGLAYLAQGWFIGCEGFSAHNIAPTLLGWASMLGWSLWLLILAWRMKERAATSQQLGHAPFPAAQLQPKAQRRSA